MTTPDHDSGYPTYAQLSARPGQTAGTSWGLFPDPDRGTPTFAGPEEVLAARSCIRTGTVFGLDYPVDAFDPGMSARRTAPVHTIYSGHHAHRDDYLDGFYLQGSTQIDGLRHRRSDEIGFYGGTDDELIRPGTRPIGIQAWAETPIVSRGLLLDVAGHRHTQGDPIDHAGGEPLHLDLLEDTIRAQSTAPAPGDILMIRTGWCEWFLGLDHQTRLNTKEARRSTGIAQSKEFVEWVWDHRLALVAADNFAVECLPPIPGTPFLESAPHDKGMMHQELLAKLGMPLGELWRLDHLAAHMRDTSHWDAMIIVKPLNITGATGSPANATAIC